MGITVKTLRPYQEQAIQKLKLSLAGGCKRPMLKLPTGGGKTLIAASIVRMALAKGKRVIFCVNAISLIDQTVQKFYEEGITEIGVIQGSHELTNYSHAVQVCSIQTLARRRQIPYADLVIIDEAHNHFAAHTKWMRDWSNVPFIGLSATPYTKGLGKHYDDLIVITTTRELIDDGTLSDFIVYAPTHPDLSSVRTVAGDYHEGDLSKIMGEDRLVGDVVTSYKALASDLPALCYGVDRAHAKKLQNRFIGAGINCGYIDAYTEPPERREIARAFHNGGMRVVCNVGVLTTGIDWDVRCLILARPTKSEILFEQIVGRALRTAHGKDKAIIIDHSDTHLRLGFVTDVNEKNDTLDDGKPKKSATNTKEKETPLPKECPKCHYLKPAKVHICPGCGFKPEKQSQIEHGHGQLGELKRKKDNKIISIGDKAAFYAELRHYGMSHGYKDGWASNKYRDRFGVWPNKVGFLSPQPPSAATLSYIRHLHIKQAKTEKKPDPYPVDKTAIAAIKARERENGRQMMESIYSRGDV